MHSYPSRALACNDESHLVSQGYRAILEFVSQPREEADADTISTEAIQKRLESVCLQRTYKVLFQTKN